jgi:hypothetical protein
MYISVVKSEVRVQVKTFSQAGIIFVANYMRFRKTGVLQNYAKIESRLALRQGKQAHMRFTI